MKVLVPVKRVIDYNVKPRVKADGTGVDLANVKMSHEPVRRDRGRGSDPPEGKGRRDRGRRRSRSGRPRRRKRCAPRSRWAPTARSWSQTDETVEPLAVAKLLKAIAEEEQPGLIILGKQAIDDDNNQTGQMLAALIGRPQGTFASKVEVDGRHRHGHARGRWRSRDGERSTLPAIVTTDLRLNEPRYASLPNIMKAKSKPLAHQDAGRLRRRRRAAPRDAQGRPSRPSAAPASRWPMSMSWSRSSRRWESRHEDAGLGRARRRLAQGRHARRRHRGGEARRSPSPRRRRGRRRGGRGGRQDRRRRQGACRRRRGLCARAGRERRAAGRRADGPITTRSSRPPPRTARTSRRASPRCST